MQRADAEQPETLRWALLAAAGALLLAPLDWPYGYYQLLRLVVTAVSVWLAIVAANEERSGWALAGGLIAILFNPILPVTFERSVWAVVDIAVALVFLTAAFRLIKLRSA